MPRIVATVGEGYNFPLGITYISAVMKEAGFNVFTLNLNHIKGKIEEIINSEVAKNKIDILMTGGLSFQYNSLKNIVDYIHDNHPQVKIIIGGGIITADPETSMTALEYADIGVIGEGEITVVELCNALQEYSWVEGTLSEISGIVYMNNGNWIRTKAREEIKNLDSLPFPDYDGFELNKYLELSPVSINNVTKNRAFFIISSRSCPYQCTFCFHTMGKMYRQRSMNNVTREIEILIEKYRVTHITMSDELFARKKERVQIIEDISKKFSITWAASFRVDDIDVNLIEILKHGNCISMNFGLESASNKILKSMCKHITIEQIEKSLKLAYNANLPINGNFIFGDIEETVETAIITLDWWEQHRDYNIGLNFINVYPGTYLYKYALQNGIIKDAIQFLKDGCPQINVSKLSDYDLSYIVKRIFGLSAKVGLVLENMENISLSDSGRISFNGKCVKCSVKQRFTNAKLFVGNNWVTCTKCGQRYEVRLPEKLIQTLINNLQNYHNIGNKIGLFGITAHSLPLFENNDIFKNERFIFIDNSTQKQMIKIHGKKVYSPDELLINEVDTVIFFYPNSYAVVAEEVKRKYPNVRQFINVYDLLIKSEEI
jgi:radical SAM superfamily enzyme YgiQ (UPF0313 family)